MVHDQPLEDGYGAEAYVRRLVGGLRSAGDDVDVLAGRRIHRGAGKLLDVWDPAAARLVADHARVFRPDVLHFHNLARELSASVLTAAAGVPAVMTVHDFRLLGAHEHNGLSARGRVERVVAGQVRRLAKRRLQATVGVSEPVSDALRHNGFPAVTTVPVPAAAPAVVSVPAAQCRDVAVIARLTKDKGVGLALDAFDAATADSPAGDRIIVAGDGPERDRLVRRSRPLRDRVEFVGRLDETEVSALLGRVRAVVVASQPRHRPEGSSLALVEAAVNGRPVLASADPAVQSVAGEIGNALVVADWSVDAFAAALRRILDDDALVTDLGERGRQNGQKLHSVGVVTAATREVYRSVIAKHR
jgi:glycosyltransferase involved in cell wall biosynthesis